MKNFIRDHPLGMPVIAISIDLICIAVGVIISITSNSWITRIISPFVGAMIGSLFFLACLIIYYLND